VLAKAEGGCLHPVGAGLNWKLVLPPSWCWVKLEVGASTQLVLGYMRVGALCKLVLAFGGCGLVELVLN